jgi:hypothetical protein
MLKHSRSVSSRQNDEAPRCNCWEALLLLIWAAASLAGLVNFRDPTHRPRWVHKLFILGTLTTSTSLDNVQPRIISRQRNSTRLAVFLIRRFLERPYRYRQGISQPVRWGESGAALIELVVPFAKCQLLPRRSTPSRQKLNFKRLSCLATLSAQAQSLLAPVLDTPNRKTVHF